MRLALWAFVSTLAASAFSCGGEGALPDAPVASTWTVLVSPSAPDAVRWAADDVARYLGQMGQVAAVSAEDGALRCRPGEGRVALVGSGLGDAELRAGATDQTFRIVESRCGDGRLVLLEGGGVLGRQYAAYEWLHALGVRFFHPEEEYVPASPRWPEEPLVREHTPAFTWRSASLHLTHPLELGDAFELHDESTYPEAKRYIDWLVKNGASYGHGGVGAGDLASYGLERGFPRASGLRLYGSQQGSTSVLDPDDPRPWQEQLAAAIDERMGADPARYPAFFSVGFDPSEFTEAPDDLVVEQLTFFTEYLTENYPGVRPQTTNHGTNGAPTETYGVRYYDLPKFAPPELGVVVHTLMFYDLFRPAPVYGNTDFHNLYDFMEEEHLTRPLWYFPESAWWLTFDLPVPLYLPITIEARDRDIQGIAHMLEGGLDGHRVFGSGHEWGYWQNEYCSFRMVMDLAYRYSDCLRDIAGSAGETAGTVVAEVLEEVIAKQAEHLFDEKIIAYMVGTDDETELAASVGIEFHPLPAAPAAILRWDAGEVQAFEDEVLPVLLRIDTSFRALTARLNAVADDVDPRGRAFFEEIRDGVEMYGLRARHQWQVYGALAMLRRARLEGLTALAADAEEQLADAAATTEDAIDVIRRREGGYRYHPIERSIAGGPGQDEDENWTIYTYRYLNRTHHAFYFTRIDALAQEAFAGAAEAVEVEDAILGPGEEALVRVTDADLLATATVDWGDGATDPVAATVTHAYGAPGVYTVAVSGTRGGEAFDFAADVAVVTEQHTTGFSGKVVAPEGAEIIEGVTPGLVFGPIDDGRMALGFAVDATNHVDARWWSALDRTAGSAMVLESVARDVEVPVITRSAGTILASLTVIGGVLELPEAAGPATLRGELGTEDVIQTVVSIGGFEERGARSIVASTLGYTPDTLPERVAFIGEFTLE